MRETRWRLSSPREHQPKPVPPEAHRLMTKVDPALEEQVLHIPQRQREADIPQATN
jgi:hypothetical protein